MSLYYKQTAWYDLLKSKPSVEAKMEVLIQEIYIRSELSKQLIESYGYFNSITIDELRYICEQIHKERI